MLGHSPCAGTRRHPARSLPRCRPSCLNPPRPSQSSRLHLLRFFSHAASSSFFFSLNNPHAGRLLCSPALVTHWRRVTRDDRHRGRALSGHASDDVVCVCVCVYVALLGCCSVACMLAFACTSRTPRRPLTAGSLGELLTILSAHAPTLFRRRRRRCTCKLPFCSRSRFFDQREVWGTDTLAPGYYCTVILIIHVSVFAARLYLLERRERREREREEGH